MIGRFFLYRSVNVLLVLAGLIVVFSLLSPNFAFTSPDNLRVFFALAPEFGIIALGVGMLMICGEFDLSIGSILVFCSFVFVRLSEIKMSLPLAGLITFFTGAIFGLINGVITVRGRIPSFITTLGTMMLWRGTTLLLSLGIQKPFTAEASPVFCSIFTGEINGILPAQILWFIGVGIFLGVLLHFHKFGNWVYATGDNKEAARAMGINTDRVKITCFIIVGILCALVAIMQIIRVSSFSSRAGQGWELKAVAASVVGGTSLMGGIGSMMGIFCGTLIIVVIENALTMLRIPYSWTYVVFGLVIISSVLINLYMERRKLKYGSLFFRVFEKVTPPSPGNSLNNPQKKSPTQHRN